MLADEKDWQPLKIQRSEDRTFCNVSTTGPSRTKCNGATCWYKGIVGELAPSVFV